VARDGYCQSIGSAGLGDGADGFWRADEPCDVGVACRCAGGDFLEGLPDAFLKRGSADVEREIESEPGRFEKADHFRDELFEIRITADQVGAGELVLQFARKSVRVVPEKNGANPTIASRDEERAERTFAHRETDIGLRSAGTIA